jgi:hypothetical protein
LSLVKDARNAETISTLFSTQKSLPHLRNWILGRHMLDGSVRFSLLEECVVLLRVIQKAPCIGVSLFGFSFVN